MLKTDGGAQRSKAIVRRIRARELREFPDSLNLDFGICADSFLKPSNESSEHIDKRNATPDDGEAQSITWGSLLKVVSKPFSAPRRCPEKNRLRWSRRS